MQDGRNFIFLKEGGGGGNAFIKSILSSVSMSLCTMPTCVVNKLEKTQRDFL